MISDPDTTSITLSSSLKLPLATLYPNAMWYGRSNSLIVGTFDPPMKGCHSSNVTMLKYFLAYIFSLLYQSAIMIKLSSFDSTSCLNFSISDSERKSSMSMSSKAL